MPKADVHSHLIGCMRPSTLEELAQKAGVALPRPAAQLAPYASFYEFISIYNLATTLLRSREHFERVIYEALEDAFNSSHQLHTEMFFNPQYSMEIGVPYATVVDGLCDGIREAQRRLGVSCLLIPSIGREIGGRAADEIMDAILAHRPDEVVGIGIDGPERSGPPVEFASMYARAGKAGLKRTAHVCEDNQTLQEAPPENFAVCVDVLQCDRFDHGYNLLASDDMTQRARDEGKYFTTIALTSAVGRRAQRWKSIRAMADAGLKITVNTDNPAMFGTDLTDSFKAVCDACDWDKAMAQKLTLAAVDASWLDDTDKRRLGTRFSSLLSALDAAAPNPAN